MISIIITAKEEPKTVGVAIQGFLKAIEYYLPVGDFFPTNTNYSHRKLGDKINNKQGEFEIIVVAPDEKTLEAAKKSYSETKLLQDKYGGGKAAAMNLAIEKAQGEKLIFSDGDVEVAENVIEELLKVGGEVVTGRPSQLTINNQQGTRENKYMYWQECLVEMAHKIRQDRNSRGEFLLLSGYLFCINSNILKKQETHPKIGGQARNPPQNWRAGKKQNNTDEDFKFPEHLLTEDEYLSYWLWHHNYKIKYAPLAEVKVKYADNYKDWIKQKIRSVAGGYQIPLEWKRGTAMRSFFREALGGLSMWVYYVKSFKQAYWMKLLFIARLQVWLLAWWKVKVLKQERGKVWERIESTK